MDNLAAILFAPLLSLLLGFLQIVFIVLFSVLVILILQFIICCGCFPFNKSPAFLRSLKLEKKWHDLTRWLLIDYKERGLRSGEFCEFGFTFYVGRQGAGKTTAMVEYLRRMRKRYPGCMIIANFACVFADYIMKDWRDLLVIRNGTNGVIFAIDEIHSEYSSASFKDIPESLLSEISQQRKQRVKIVATAQYFGRVAKPLREQSRDVVSCSCIFNRFIRTVTYDSVEYSAHLDNILSVKKKLKPLKKYSFVSSDDLRDCFDTYEKINRMRKIDADNRKLARK